MPDLLSAVVELDLGFRSEANRGERYLEGNYELETHSRPHSR